MEWKRAARKGGHQVGWTERGLAPQKETESKRRERDTPSQEG